MSSIKVPHTFYLHNKVLTVNEALFYGFASEISQNMVHPPPFVTLVKGITYILVELPSLKILGEVPANLRDVHVDGHLDKEWHPDGTFTAFVFFLRLGKSPDGSTKLRSRVAFGSTEDPATGAASRAMAAYPSLFYSEDEN